MANYYNSEQITIFPSSNAVDNGKVTSEHNIRDIVNRLKIKNYKMNSDDFKLSVSSNKITVSQGTALISGYKIDTNSSITLNEYPSSPSSTVQYYVVMQIRVIDSKISGDNNEGKCEGVEIRIISKSDYDGINKDTIITIGTASYSGGLWSVKSSEYDNNIYPFSSDGIMLDTTTNPPTGSITAKLNGLEDGFVSSINNDTKLGYLAFKNSKSSSFDSLVLYPSNDGSYIRISNNSNNYLNELYNRIEFHSSNSNYSAINGTGSSISLGIKADNYITVDSSDGISINSFNKNISINSGTSSIELNGSSISSNGPTTFNDIVTISSSSTDTINFNIGSNNIGSIISKKNGNSGLIKITAINNTSDNKSKIELDAKSVNVTGTITATKVYNAVYNGFGEIFRKSADEIIDYGDVVCIGQDGLVHKMSEHYSLNRIIGICSNTIGIELGGSDIPEDERVEVELIGKIWVKTDSEYILPGSLITFTMDGKARVKSESDQQNAIALSNVKDGKILVYYSGNTVR